MSAVGLEGIERSVQQTHRWINELDERLGWNNKHRSYRLLGVVLQTLRDWLSVNEAADLAAQLPSLLRGVYYEHWRPARTPVRDGGFNGFLASVDRAFRKDPIDDTGKAVATVFRLLSEKVTGGEIDDVRQSLPRDIRALWAA